MADALTADQAKELGLDDAPPEAQPLPPDQAKALGLEDDAPEDARGATAYLGAADKKSPAQASEVIKHAADAGVSTDVAEAALPDLKHEHDTNVLGGVMQTAPAVEHFIQDPAKAAFVKQEPGVFAALQWGLSGHIEIPKGFFDKLDSGKLPGLDDLPTWHAPFWAEAFKDSWVENTKIRYLQTKNALGLADEEDRAKLKQLESTYGEKDYGADGAFSKTVVTASKAIGYATGEVAAVTAATTAAIALAPEEAAATAVAGATVGGRFLWNYLQAYGPSFEKFKALGATDEDARQRASLVARDTAVIFTVTGGFASKIPGLNRILTSSGSDALSQQLAKKTVAKTLTDFVADHGAGALNGAGMLAATKASEELQANDLRAQQGKPTDWKASAEDIAATYWDGLKTMLLAGAAPGVPLLLHDVARAHYLGEDARKFETLHSAAETSQTVQNHPNEAQEYMRLAQSQGPVNYHADLGGWNQYWQSKQVEPAEAAARVMGDGGKAYAEAQMTGGDLRIPAERYLTGFAKTEHLRGLEDVVRLNQDGLSLGQVRMLDESAPKVDGDGSDEIEKDFAEKAKAAGTPDKVAEGQAKIMSAAFRTFASRLNTGETAHDLYQSFPLTIRGPGEEPVSQKDAEALISRMKPENREMATRWLAWTRGELDKRPEVTPDMERKLARFGVVDPEGYSYDANGRSMEHPIGGRKVRGEMPDELRRYRDLKREHDTGDDPQGYFQGAVRPDVTDASSQLAGRAADAAHDRGAESYLDPVTGLRNARAFDESKVPEGKAVAVITSPSIKGINDHVEHGGHDVANGVLSSAGAPLHGVDEGAARGGTNFRVLVDADKADAQLKAAIEKVKDHLGNDNIDVIGATGKTSEEAFSNLRKETDRRRLLGPEDAEHIPARGKLRAALDVSKLQATETKAKATVPPELAAKAKALSPKEYFEKIYLDHAWRTDADGKRVSEATGLLSGDGFRARPPKANTLSMDMVGLGKVPMGVGDAMLHEFARAAVRAGGEHVDAARLSGDEFVAQHDDPVILQAYADRLKNALEDLKIRYVDPTTGKAEAAPVLFRHGIGADYTAADRDLNAKRAAEGTSEVRPRGGLDEGQAAGNRVPGQADLERGRAFFDERPARPHSFPEEVTKLHQPAFHGSPHDFEQFSLHKIGTGEGAQAYGWGLYFAGKREIAEHYKNTLADRHITVDGRGKDSLTDTERYALQEVGQKISNLGRGKVPMEKALEAAREALKTGIEQQKKALEEVTAQGKYQDIIDNTRAVLERRKGALELLNSWTPERLSEKGGKLYHVDLPEDHELLDYDKKFGDQPEGVRKALEDAGIRQMLAKDEEVDYSSKDGKAHVDEWLKNMNGAQLYNKIVDIVARRKLEKYGTPLGEQERERQASEILRNYGIPGMRYLDNTSRNPKRTFLLDGKPIDSSSHEGLSKIQSEALDALDNVLLHNRHLTIDEVTERAKRYGGQDTPPEFKRAVAAMAKRLTVEQEPTSHNYVIWDDGRVNVVEKLDQANFQLESKGGRGYITFTTGENGKPRRFNIQLLENADESTLAHESMHFLSEVMGDLAQRTDAPTDLKADYQTLLTFMGHESHEDRRASMKERAQLAKLEERTPEQNARLKELTGKEERATHAWEQYLEEGKSPTPELARVFARFKNWMGKIYKSVTGVAGEFQKQYGHELKLSDDVRRVFDRMLGADKAVQEASEGNVATQPMDKLVEGMGPEQRLEYQRATEDAKVAAENEMVRRVASAQREENSAFMRDERARLQPEVEDELAKDPVMRTMRYLEKGDLAEDPGETPDFLRDPDGGPQLLNRPTVKAEYGQEFTDNLPAFMFAKGKNAGLPADELALRLGWDSGAAMLDEISTAPKYSGEVRKGVEAKMKDLYGGQLLDTPQQLASEAVAALNGPKAMAKALLELQHLRGLLDKGAAPKANVLTRDAALDTARRLIATKTVGQLTRGEQGLAGYYARAEKSAAKRSFDALDKGNVARAYAEKSAQLLNMALAREAEGKREMLEKAFKRIVHTPEEAWKGSDPDIRNAHDAILEAAGLKAPMAGLEPPSVEPFLAKAAASGAELAFDPDAIREFVQDPKDWSNLTPDEAEDIRDAALNLRHLAAVQNEYTIEGQKMARAVYFLQMEAAISQRPSQPARPRDASKEAMLTRARRTVQSIDAKLMTPDTIFSLMDAHEENGPVRRALEAPFLEARDKKRALMQEVTGKIVDMWESLPKEVRDSKDQDIDIHKDLPLPPDLVDKGLGDGPVSRKYLWMIALNMGNEGNKQRLLDGYGWTERAVMDVLDKHMSKAEWEMVQKTWDTLESLYPHLAALHERETGVRLPKVEATPVQTKHGTFEGGYFPARKENRVESGNVRQSIENVADIFGDNYQRATVASGHRKSRVEGAKYYINLDWSVVPSHIAQVVHDIAYREPVKQAARIVFDPEFRDLTNRYLGQEYGKDILPWLKAVANESADSVPANMGAIQGAIGWVRGRAMRTQLGGNLASMAQHFTDPAIGVAAGVTTARDTAMATVRAASLAGFPSMRAFALEHSSELKARSDHLTRELDRKMKDIGRNEPGAVVKGLQTTAHLAQETMSVFHDSMDKLVSTITWTAGYTEGVRKAKDAGLTDAEAHAKATKSADAAVRKIYPSHELAQQSEAIRSKTFLGGSLMFAGFANKVWNLRRQSIDKAYLTFHDGEAGFSAKASAVARVAGTFMALAAIGTTNKVLRGQGKKDDEETPEWLEKTMLAEPFNDTPLLAPLAESASSLAVTGKAQKPSFRNAPALEFLSEVYDKAAKTHGDEDLDEQQKLLRYIGTLSTVAFAGSGATQISRTLGYLDKLHTGEADPRGPLDVAGGLYYGQRKGNPANPFTAAQTAISGE